MKKILIMFILLLLSLTAFSQLPKQLESYYQTNFADTINGVREYRLFDGTRVDIVTDTFAIEVDFASKWAESIGQALYYGDMLNKKPGILLVVNGKLEDRFVARLVRVAANTGITIWLWDYTTNKWCKVHIFREITYSYQF
jgi:hypothetical protein